VLAALAFALTSCRTSAPRGFVAKEWSLTLRELNIVPVFPPREDVQVGDIYIAPSRPEDEAKIVKDKGFTPIGLWVASVTLSNELSRFYSERNSFPRTSGDIGAYMAGQSTNPFPVFAQPSDTNRNIFEYGDTNRLRLVGFPSFMSATVKQGDLSGVVPVEAMGVAFAGTGSSSDSVTLSVPVAESYGLPASDVFSKIVIDKKFFLEGKNFKAEDILIYAAHQHEGKDAETNRFGYIRLITEVFYTRAVDIAINRKRSFGFGANVKPAATVPTSGTETPAPGSTNYMFTTRTESGTSQDRAADLNRQLSESLNQSIPGGSVKFVAAGEHGVTMRRTYDRPVAIGYRGLLLELYEDGTIKSHGAISGEGSLLPTALPPKK